MWSLAQVNPDHLAEIHLSGVRFPQNHAQKPHHPRLPQERIESQFMARRYLRSSP